MGSFGKQLFELRKKVSIERGLPKGKIISQEEFGKLFNPTFSRNSIYNYEKDIRLPSSEDLIIIAEHFNVSTDWLLGRAKNKSFNNEEIRKITGLSEESIERLKWTQRKYGDKVFETNPSTMETTVRDRTPEEIESDKHLFDNELFGINLLISKGIDLCADISRYVQCKADKVLVMREKNDGGQFEPYTFLADEMLLLKVQNRLINLRKEIQSKEDK